MQRYIKGILYARKGAKLFGCILNKVLCCRELFGCILAHEGTSVTILPMPAKWSFDFVSRILTGNLRLVYGLALLQGMRHIGELSAEVYQGTLKLSELAVGKSRSRAVYSVVVYFLHQPSPAFSEIFLCDVAKR